MDIHINKGFKRRLYEYWSKWINEGEVQYIYTTERKQVIFMKYKYSTLN